MSKLVSSDLLDHLRTLYPAQPSPLRNPWYIVAAVAFSTGNCPEAVPLVFQHAMKELEDDSDKENHIVPLTLVRKLREALFQSGMMCGYPKAINGLNELFAATPVHLRDKKPMRDITKLTEELARMGEEHFMRTYGDRATSVQGFLHDLYPDLGFFAKTFAYGYTHSFSEVLSAVETSFVLIAALIASDNPRQVEGHLRGAVRNGASLDEVKAARQIAIEASRAVGITWKTPIPDI